MIGLDFKVRRAEVLLSFYEVSVGQYLQTLGSTQHVRRTAEVNAETGVIDLGAIVNFRLHDDMLHIHGVPVGKLDVMGQMKMGIE